MFRKVRISLAVLFASVSSIILIGMSLLLLFFQRQNFYENAEHKFQQDVQGFLYTFKNSTIITYDWLKAVQRNYSYDFYLYDNGIPMRFLKDTKSADDIKMLEVFRQEHPVQTDIQSTETISHKEYRYNTEKEVYQISSIILFGENGNTEIYVISSLQSVQTQLKNLYFRFAIIIVLGVALLFGFSWLYTGKLLQPIQKSQKQQADFIAAASHEIRSPVHTILSALRAIEAPRDGRQGNGFLDIAREEGQRLTYLTNDLLMLARGNSNSISVNFGRTELDTIVLESYEAFLQPAREKQIALTVSLPEDELISEHMDGERIRQVISILLDNAISYTPEHGTVALQCEKTKNHFILKVADNGAGLSKEQKQHIFERFYRADTSRHDTEHFGLGLSIAKELVTLHSGTIFVTDTEGGGTTFLVKLPK